MTSPEALDRMKAQAIHYVIRKLIAHHPTRWAILRAPVITGEHEWEGPNAILYTAICKEVASMGHAMVCDMVRDLIDNGQMDTANSHCEIYTCVEEDLYEQLGLKVPWKQRKSQ